MYLFPEIWGSGLMGNSLILEGGGIPVYILYDYVSQYSFIADSGSFRPSVVQKRSANITI